MKIQTTALHQILRDYMVQIIVPKLPNNFLQFGVAFASSYISSNLLNQYLAPHMPTLQLMGIIQGDEIDLDSVKEAALKALEQCHGSFVIANYKVDKQDIEDLYEIASRYAKAESPMQPSLQSQEINAI